MHLRLLPAPTSSVLSSTAMSLRFVTIQPNQRFIVTNTHSRSLEKAQLVSQYQYSNTNRTMVLVIHSSCLPRINNHDTNNNTITFFLSFLQWLLEQHNVCVARIDLFFSLIARLFIFPESIQPHAIGFDIIPIILMMIAIVGVRTSQFLFCCSFNFATLITSQTVLGHSASCRPNPLCICVPTHLLRLVVIRLTHFFGSRSPFLSSPFFLFTAVQ